MSLWKRIACSSEVEQRMTQYYAEKGLADIRVYLAQWIEERIMSERINNPTKEVYEQFAQRFYEDLQKKLLTLHNDNLSQFKLTEICTIIAHSSALELYSCLRNGLQTELQLSEHLPQMAYYNATPVATPSPVGVGGFNNGIGGYGGVGGGGNVGAAIVGNGIDNVGINTMNGFNTNPVPDRKTSLIFEKLDALDKKLDNVNERIQAEQHTHTQIHNYIQANQINQNKLTLDADELQQRELMHERYNRFCANINMLTNELGCFVTEYDALQDQVTNDLKSWQRNQALAGNGAPNQDNLNEIQICLEMLVGIVCKILHELNILLNMASNIMSVPECLKELIAHVSDVQKVLFFSAFIVEKQPPQVMKTNTRFATSVRWLIGPSLGIAQNCPTVECIILSEAQAQRHTAQRTMAEVSTTVPPTSGEISNNSATMEYNQQMRVLSASFRNLQLKKIKRAEKKGTESVMDEKFSLLFYTSTIVNNCRIYVWTLSLPVVVIVHGNQEPQSWATITWDNAFSEIVREPFVVPERVTWQQLSYALNTKFASASGRPLTGDNLNFLYEKLFRNDGLNGDHKEYITWSQFCKDTLSDRSFTFWDWFFAIMKLTKDHLLGLWKAGLIVGFINKQKTSESLLSLSRPGVFLLRFSDSELGGISVALVSDNFEVMNLAPWTAKDLNIRGLADRLSDIAKLTYVYPSNKPKNESFREFYTTPPEESAPGGYVANTIRAVVPAIEAGGSLAQTPQHHIQSPSHQDMGPNLFNSFDMYLNGEQPDLSDMNWDSI